MIENIESILRDECKLVKDRQIIVGVSGGPDSLCLMEILREAGYPIIVAHFNHQLRAEADHEAHMVEKMASRLMLASVTGSGDVRVYAQKEKLSIEEAARNLRYRFLFELAHEHDAQAVAVGHTADDQVETILMHFLRGAGLTGLKGMSHHSIVRSIDPQTPIIRPLLDVWREETLEYCSAHGLPPHHDSSNDLLDFQRNRIRHLLIPDLETHNPKFREAVLRMARSLKGDHASVMETLETDWQETVSEVRDDFIAFDSSLFSSHSLGRQRNLVKQAAQSLRPGLDLNFAAIERACNFINEPRHSHRVDLMGGLRMFREMDKIYIYTPDANLFFNLWPQMPGLDPLPVQVPGRVNLAGGWELTCERWPIPETAKEHAERNEDQYRAWLDADTLPGAIEMRVRQQGDQFEPLGLDGHSQKLSDFMVNEKMPQRARDRWPLLCSGRDIIWVPGYRPAHKYRLTESTKNVLYFSMTHPPDKITE